MKKEPVLTHLIEANDIPAYTVQQIIDGLGLVMVTPEAATPSPGASQTATASKGYEGGQEWSDVVRLPYTDSYSRY